MKTTPRGNRLHIGFFGRRNAGKSSLFNALAGHDLSIVSPEPGTTTDPVNKGMELQPLGPVMLVDTAGLDDVGLLGDQRKKKTRRAIDRIDIGIIVVGKEGWGAFEADILAEFQRREKRIIIALSHARERGSGEKAGLQQLSVPVVLTDAPDGYGLDALRKALVAVAPEVSAGGGPLISDIVGTGECALLVIPIDSEAPKGRIILPQVQVMRELLDNGALGMITRELELEGALGMLGRKPKLVVTDSQAFDQVSAIVPEDILLTSFSILFARAKGDLIAQSRGAAHIARLRPGATILVAEACTHHPTGEDIGRHKLPAWLKKQVGGDLEFVVRAGRTFPEDLSLFDLVVHCGACMWNRSEMNARLQFAAEAGVAITNYGLAIAHCHGIMDRALRPFPDALAAYRQTAALEVE